jgi:hypothetical protein
MGNELVSRKVRVSRSKLTFASVWLSAMVTVVIPSCGGFGGQSGEDIEPTVA